MRKPRTTAAADRDADVAASELEALLAVGGAPGAPATRTRIGGAVVGVIVAFVEHGTVPLVTYAGQPGTAAIPARTTVDLHGAHVGRRAVLLFEDGDPQRPIVVGCLRDAVEGALPEAPGRVEVDADGERLVVSAKRQMVLRCGKASITLTRAGKVLVEGSYVVSSASGVNRIKGGSVQIN